jgi:hypothetical protein
MRFFAPCHIVTLVFDLPSVFRIEEREPPFIGGEEGMSMEYA